ncbi:transcription termination factor Rho [Desulfoglaeba alkanexedens]|jgi:cysteinyl-tRNA synthetase|uniref:Transcription termination factor Rho n=1 Tax=Desulfoglaeba alkanexedens ALDC TaxID=980445 RepID=A0A4P8L040_9BACT|nr:transcription termination factor Rho [Desulfoglaeba alkanexedens]QCQ21206.1 transcription termination factor Rho [Desulfoglaeba alkanexedens ALDC]
MGKKKEKEKKEKPLEKMTAKELREIALTLEGVVGVHAMNKNELIAVIKEARGIVDQGAKKKTADVRAIKKKIGELREKREAAKAAGNSRLADALRRRISNLKKKTRRAA